MRPPDDAERIVRPGFNARVYALVLQVPPGRVSTYGDVAAALGSPRVARHVGFALAALRDDDVPWHRVVNAQGTLSARGDTARALVQRHLLASEGVSFDAAGRIALAEIRFRTFRPDAG